MDDCDRMAEMAHAEWAEEERREDLERALAESRAEVSELRSQRDEATGLLRVFGEALAKADTFSTAPGQKTLRGWRESCKALLARIEQEKPHD